MLTLTGYKLLLFLHGNDLCLLLRMLLRLLLYLGLILELAQLSFSSGIITVQVLFAFPLGMFMLNLLGSICGSLSLVLELSLVLTARLLVMGDLDVFKSLEAFKARLEGRCPGFSISSGRGSIRRGGS